MVVASLLVVGSVQAQELIITDSTAIQPENQLAMASPEERETNRMKIDGVAAVVGD